MSDLSGSLESAGVSASQDHLIATRPATSALSQDERICLWMLRLLLPLIVVLCGQLVFWMWFDDVYRGGTWSIMSGVLLMVVGLAVSCWAGRAWLTRDGF
jgi:hypothetical protein